MGWESNGRLGLERGGFREVEVAVAAAAARSNSTLQQQAEWGGQGSPAEAPAHRNHRLGSQLPFFSFLSPTKGMEELEVEFLLEER